MRLTVPYVSVLLVASLSCVWATPIAVDRGSMLQRRSESHLNSRATHGMLVARAGEKGGQASNAVGTTKETPVVVTDFYFTFTPKGKLPPNIPSLMVAYVKKQFEDHKKSWPADAPTPIRLAEEPPVEGEKPPVKKAEPRVKHYLEKASFPYQAEFTALGKDYVAIIDDKGRGMLYVFKTPKSVSPIEITPGLVNIYGESEAIQKQGEASQAGFPKSIAEMKDLRNPKLAGYTVIKDPKKGREGDVKKVDKEVNFGSRW